jgi:hypothetical protein
VNVGTNRRICHFRLLLPLSPRMLPPTYMPIKSATNNENVPEFLNARSGGDQRESPHAECFGKSFPPGTIFRKNCVNSRIMALVFGFPNTVT